MAVPPAAAVPLAALGAIAHLEAAPVSGQETAGLVVLGLLIAPVIVHELVRAVRDGWKGD